MLPEITINFHPSILFCGIAAGVCFGTFGLLCLVQVKKACVAAFER